MRPTSDPSGKPMRTRELGTPRAWYPTVRCRSTVTVPPTPTGDPSCTRPSTTTTSSTSATVIS